METETAKKGLGKKIVIWAMIILVIVSGAAPAITSVINALTNR